MISSRKSAIISLHSWKLIKELHTREDQVIYRLTSHKTDVLCIFSTRIPQVRKTRLDLTTIIHLLSSAGIFVYHRIFDAPDLFSSPANTVEFLRYMYNFGSWVKGRPYPPSNINYAKMMLLQRIKKPTKQSRMSGLEKTPKISSENLQNAGGSSVITDTVMQTVAILGYEVLKIIVCSFILLIIICLISSHLQRNVIWVSDKSNTLFVAKQISRGPEVEILKYLKTTLAFDRRNHTIPIIGDIQHVGNHVLIIMPHHTVLDQLENLDHEGYYQLRRQLFEVRRCHHVPIRCPDTIVHI